MDDATRGLLARALAVLRKLEWSANDYMCSGLPICECCSAINDPLDGVPEHAGDCDLERTMDELAAAIGEGGTGER